MAANEVSKRGVLTFEEASARGWVISEVGPNLVRGERRAGANHLIAEQGSLDLVLERITAYERFQAGRKPAARGLIPPGSEVGRPNDDVVA